jgi:putative cell wall-binding protein
MYTRKRIIALVLSIMLSVQLLGTAGLVYAEGSSGAPPGENGQAVTPSEDVASWEADPSATEPDEATDATDATDASTIESDEADSESGDLSPLSLSPLIAEFEGMTLTLLQVDTFALDTQATDRTISTAQDMISFATAVNSGTDFAGATITLAGDLLSVSLPPIGTPAHPFKGTFDGAGHTIANLQIQVPADKSYVGLFGYAAEGSVIKNVKLLGGSLSISETAANGVQIHHIGGIVGYAAGSIEGCTSNLSITLSSQRAAIEPSFDEDDNSNLLSPATDIGSIRQVGGLVGAMGKAATMKNCSSAAAINITSPINVLEYMAYVVGEVGGLVGVAGDDADLTVYPVIEDSQNSGKITFDVSGSGATDRFGEQLYSASSCVGGIVGATTGKVIRCTNSGDMQTSQGTLENPTAGYGASNSGGIVGALRDNRFDLTATAGHLGDSHMALHDPGYDVWAESDGATRPVTVGIYDCVNNATVVGRQSVGGIVGSTGSFVEVEGSANYGDVKGCRWNKPFVGGVAGNIRGDVRYCYNQGKIFSVTGAGYYCAGIAGGFRTNVSANTPDELRYTPNEMTGCYNTGSVYTTSSGFRSGALVGENQGYVHHNAYLPELTLDGRAVYDDSGTVADNREFSTAELRGSDGIALLNIPAANNGWQGVFYLPAPNSANNNGYPVLSRTFNTGGIDLNTIAALTVDSVKAAAYSASVDPLPTIVLKDGSNTLLQNADFRVIAQSGTANVSPSATSYAATIIGMGRYRGTWTTTVSYQIVKAGISSCAIVTDPVIFNWEAQDPASPANADKVRLLDSQGNIVDRSQYEVVSMLGQPTLKDEQEILHHFDYKNVHSSTYKYDVKVAATASSPNYEGETIQTTWRIDSASLYYAPKNTDPSRVPTAVYDAIVWGGREWNVETVLEDKTGASIQIAYTGKPIKPTIKTVTYLGRPMADATDKEYWLNPTAYDYRYIYGNPNPEQDDAKTETPSTNVSPANEPDCMTIRYASTAGNFENYTNVFYQIVPASLELTTPSEQQPYLVNVAAIPAQKTTGRALRPALTVTYNGTTLVEGTNYTLAWSNNYLPGTGSVTITGTGNYTGSRTVNFTIEPGAPTRLAGTVRAHTAALASLRAFDDPSKVDTVIVAYAFNFPDALAASTLAGVSNAPILLTDTLTLDDYCKTELLRLSPSKVYVLGSTDVIQAQVIRQIESLAFAPSVKRLGGPTRYETARLIADEAVTLGADVSEAFLATGDRFPDALAVSPIAVIKKIPILLTSSTGLTPTTADFIRTHNIKKITIIGDASVVPTSVENTLKQSYGCQIERLAGGNRYETARRATVALVARYGLTPTLVGVATGDTFPDALSGGAAMGARGGVLVLTPTQSLHNDTRATLGALKPNKPAIEILGSSAAITDAVQQDIKTYLGY